MRFNFLLVVLGAAWVTENVRVKFSFLNGAAVQVSHHHRTNISPIFRSRHLTNEHTPYFLDEH